MARFYATMKGNRGEASRMGSASSGMSTWTAGWQGAIHVELYDKDGVDMACVTLDKWHGQGIYKVLYDGPVGGMEDGGKS